MIRRWFGIGLVGCGLLLSGCGGPTTPAERLDAWAKAVQEHDAETAATYMNPAPADWAWQVEKVHRRPVIGYRIAKPLAPNPNGTGQIATVLWEREAEDPFLHYACIKDVVVKDDGIVVLPDRVGVCSATGDSAVPTN